MKKSNIDLTYNNLCSIFIYDKRTRNILYKFIGWLEEDIRSKFLNKFKLSGEDIKIVYKLKFSELSEICHKNKIIDDKKEFQKILELRNSVFHNQLILIKNNQVNLGNKEKISILYKYLDEQIKKSFLSEIKKIEDKKINKEKYYLEKFYIDDELKIKIK